VSSPELAGAHVERMEHSVVAVIGDPYLRLDEQLGPIDAACGDRGANAGLVEVRGGRVDHPVPDPQGLLDGRPGFVRRGLEDAEPERGQLDAVIEANRPPVCRLHQDHYECRGRVGRGDVDGGWHWRRCGPCRRSRLHPHYHEDVWTGLTKAWTAADANLPEGWELRGVAKGPRAHDPEIASREWCAWARPAPGNERDHQPPIVEGRADSPQQAVNALAQNLRTLGRDKAEPAR